jgi:hypothetical protein
MALASASLCAGWLSRIPLWLRHDGVTLLWIALAVTAALLLPAASYLAVVPVWAAALTSALALATRLESTRSRRRGAALALVLLPCFVTASMWLPTAAGLSMGVGLMAHPAIASALALCFTAAIPALADVEITSRRTGAAVAALVGVVALLVAWLVPAYSAQRPARLSITHLQRPDGASWIVDTTWAEPPAALREAAGLGDPIRSPLPLVGFGNVATGKAPAVALPAPVLERVGGAHDQDDNPNLVRIRVRSQREADLVALIFDPSAPLVRARVEGQVMPIRSLDASSPWYAGQQMITFLGAPTEGLVIELLFGAPVPEELVVVDVAYGLPAAAAPLLEARGRRAAPSQSGDLSIVVSPAKL